MPPATKVYLSLPGCPVNLLHCIPEHDIHRRPGSVLCGDGEQITPAAAGVHVQTAEVE